MSCKTFVTILPYWPSVDWCVYALCSSQIIVPNVAYNKQWHCNKTSILTAQGTLQMSVPLVGGRQQRLPFTQVQPCYQEAWQKKHCRSIQSAYGNSPFFETIFPYVEQLYSTSFTTLYECNMATWLLAKKLLQVEIEITIGTENVMPTAIAPLTYQYQQVFELPFTPHLSVLDLLMNEGRAAKEILTYIGKQIVK